MNFGTAGNFKWKKSQQLLRFMFRVGKLVNCNSDVIEDLIETILMFARYDDFYFLRIQCSFSTYCVFISVGLLLPITAENHLKIDICIG